MWQLPSIWNHAIGRYAGRLALQYAEVPKVIVSTSKAKVTKLCLVHLAPISTTILILYLNLHGIYIGQDFAGPIKSETINLLLIQIAAKTHEIMIGWSLGLIVFNAVRNELLSGDGLPLGLIGSGLSFTSFEFFFRKEFYAAVMHWFNHQRTVGKAGFVALIVISGLTVMLAGPSSATLLVPKNQEWPSGGSKYFLNGSSEDFWPADLGGKLEELKQICNETNSATQAVCPAGGFASLWEHWGRNNAISSHRADVRNYVKRLSGSSYYWPIHSPGSLIPPRFVVGVPREDDEPLSNTWLVLPHAAPVTILQQITTDWWKAIAPADDTKPSVIDDRQAFSTNRNAIANTRCTSPQNLSETDTLINFPSLKGRFNFAEAIGLNLENTTFMPTDHLRFRWVHLPYEFGALSIGGLFEGPWLNNASRSVIACSVQTGWVPAQTMTDGYTFWTGWYPWNITFGERTPVYNYLPGQIVSTTTGRIALGDTWLNLLTPPTTIKPVTSRNPSPSTIESIFENAGLGTTSSQIYNHDTTLLVESILTSVIVDGISRYNSHRIFTDPNPSTSTSQSLSPEIYSPLPNFASLLLKSTTALRTPSISPENLTTLSVQMKITGFAYRPSIAGGLSMAVLLTHLVLASMHIVYLVSKRETSGCWSYVSELVALAYNSRPATSGPGQSSVLTMTGAGIQCGETFGRVGRIIVRADPSGKSERVELVFEDQRQGQEESSRLVESVALMGCRSDPVTNGSFVHHTTWPGIDFDRQGHTSQTDVHLSKLGEKRYPSSLVKVDWAYG